MKLNIWKKNTQTNTATQTAENQLERFFESRVIGQPVRYGHLEMIPIFGAACAADAYAAPETALKLTNVRTYGEMHLKNTAEVLPTIVPLHLGYFQQGAQNHAMCTAWILTAQEEKLFTDACCIQQAQGGYIKNSDDRFIVLPHNLRNKAFELKGQNGYSKLWNAIAKFNQAVGLKNRGHLDELKQAFQPQLLQTTYHLEPQSGQTGAIFLCNDTVVGIELAPDANYWAELHNPLVMYTYAPLRLIQDFEEKQPIEGLKLVTEGITTLKALKTRYQHLQQDRKERANNIVQNIKVLVFDSQKAQSQQQHTLLNIKAKGFAGQAVMNGAKPAYLSLFSTQHFVVD